MKASKALWVVAVMVFVEGALALGDLAIRNHLFERQSARFFEEQPGSLSVSDLMFSPDSGTLYGIGGQEAPLEGQQDWIGAWDTKSGDLRWQRKVREPVVGLQVSPSGAVLLTWPEKGTPTLWNASAGVQRGALEMNHARGMANEFYFTPDEKRIMGCFQEGIQVWSASTGKREAFWPLPKGESGWPGSLQFSADGTKVLVGIVGWSSKEPGKFSDSSSVQLWDTKTGRVLEHYTGNSTVAALAPTADKIAVIQYHPEEYTKNAGGLGDTPYSITLWDLKSGRELESPRLAANLEPESLKFRPDGTVLCKGTVLFTELQDSVWNIRTNRLTEKPVPILDYGDESTLNVSALSPNEKIRAVVSESHQGILYNAATNTILCELESL